jgi:leucyl-tRNA synthetase
MYLMFAAPLELGARWDPNGVPGTHRFLSRVWNLVQDYEEANVTEVDNNTRVKILRPVHKMIQKMTNDIEENRYNTAIAAAMGTVNELYKIKSEVFGRNEIWQEALETLVAAIAPFAPHISDELWEQLGHSTSIHKDTWPKWDEELVKEETITLAVQINGKVRAEINVPADISEEDAIALAKENEKIKDNIAGKQIKKAIYVPGRLVSLVV